MLINGERGPQSPSLRNIAEAELSDLRRRTSDKLFAHETHRAACDRKETNDCLAQRRLAHSVAPDERKDSVLEPQIHALQCVAAAIKDVQSPDFQKIGGAALRHGRYSRDRVLALPGPPRSRWACLL